MGLSERTASRCGGRAGVFGVLAILLAAAACTGGGAGSNAEESYSKPQPRGSDALVALTQAGSENPGDYAVYYTLEQFVAASELVFSGDITGAEIGRTLIHGGDRRLGVDERAIFTVRVDEVLAADEGSLVGSGSEVLVEIDRPSDISIESYDALFPPERRALFAVVDYTDLQLGEVVYNDERHRGQTIYAPLQQGFVLKGLDGVALNALTPDQHPGVVNPSEEPSDKFDELVEEIRTAGRRS